MSSADSVEGHEHLRLFAALALPGDAVERLVAWQHRELADSDGVRIVPTENLHVTLAFLGPRPAAAVPGILAVLREAAERAKPPLLTAGGYRETRSVGMVTLVDEGGGAARLADEVGEGLERLGVYEREHRKWLAHVTVVRFRRAPGARPPLPDLGAVSPSEVALYHSVLRPTGAQYEILQSVPLGG